MEKNPLVTIIIVNFNTKDFTVSCIESIKKYVKTSYEIILVDNNSNDGTIGAITKKALKVKIVKNKENVGFAKANNQGAKLAKGKYILLLNSDTLLFEDCLTPSINYLESNANCGILSCKLLNKDHTTQPTGGYFPTPIRIFNWMFGLDDLPVIGSLLTPFHPKKSFYSVDKELDWVTGAFFLVRKEIYNDLHGLDEDYFMYVEEMDFCYRAKKKDWKVQYLSSPKVVHFGGASSDSSFAIKNELKNQILFYKKHKTILQRTIVRLLLKSGSLIRAILFAILGNRNKYETYIKLAITL